MSCPYQQLPSRLCEARSRPAWPCAGERWRESRVVRKRARLDCEAVRTQHGEEPLGIPDCGSRDDLAAGEIGQRPSRAVAECDHGDRLQPHADCAWPLESRAVDDDVDGGIGVTEECPAEKYLRDAKVAQIYEGTTFMQLNTIARSVLRDGS